MIRMKKYKYEIIMKKMGVIFRCLLDYQNQKN